MKGVPLERRGDYLVTMYELEADVCRQMLARSSFGRVAFDDVDGHPTILPINYRFVGGAVLFRARTGSILDRLGSGQIVAFEADQIDPIAESGWSVLVRGTATHVRDTARIASLGDTPVRPWAPGPRDRWIEIHAEQVTGRIIRRRRLSTESPPAPYMPPD